MAQISKKIKQIKSFWIEIGILHYIRALMRETIEKLSVYDPRIISKKHGSIGAFSEKLEAYSRARNDLFEQYIETENTKPNYPIFWLVAQPYKKWPSAFERQGNTEIRSSDAEVQALFEFHDEEARRWEQSPAGLEWRRYWNEFHDDMYRLLNNETATAIERLSVKIEAGHRRIDEDIAKDAPKALWRYQFAFDMCWYWRNLHSALPGNNPDHPVVGFVEAAWQTVLECAEEAIGNPDSSKFQDSDYRHIAHMRNLLPKTELERWMSLSWERPIRSALRKLKE